MKIIIEKPEELRNNVNLFLINNIKKVAINPSGAYCITKFIVYNHNLNLRFLLIKNIQSNINLLFYHKYSCSILLLLLKYFHINSCIFIFNEIQNKLYELLKNPVSNSFVNKIFVFLKSSGNTEILNNLIHSIFSNNNLLKLVHSIEHGIGDCFLNKVINFITNNETKKATKNILKKIIK